MAWVQEKLSTWIYLHLQYSHCSFNPPITFISFYVDLKAVFHSWRLHKNAILEEFVVKFFLFGIIFFKPDRHNVKQFPAPASLLCNKVLLNSISWRMLSPHSLHEHKDRREHFLQSCQLSCTEHRTKKNLSASPSALTNGYFFSVDG